MERRQLRPCGVGPVEQGARRTLRCDRARSEADPPRRPDLYPPRSGRSDGEADRIASRVRAGRLRARRLELLSPAEPRAARAGGSRVVVRIQSRLPAMDQAAVRAAIEGLPEADDYELIVQPLRYRSAPHLAAYTVFEDKT